MLVADAQAILIARTRDTLVLLGLDPSPPAPATANPDLAVVLNEAIVDGMQACGLAVATPTAALDPDLVRVPAYLEPKFKDAAWLRLLRTLRDRARSRSDQTTGLDSYRFSQVAAGLQATIEREQATWEQHYLAGSDSVVVGPMATAYRTPGNPPWIPNPYSYWYPPWP